VTASQDFRDSCIEQLADEGAALREHIARLAERAVCAEADRDAFRRVAVAALDRAHDLDVEIIEIRQRYRRALDDARGLRMLLLELEGRSRAA